MVVQRVGSVGPFSMYERIPFMARRWYDSTPKDFIFTSKVPGMVTHAKCLLDCERETRLFLSGIEPLRKKLGFLLFLFPSYFTKDYYDRFREYFLEMPKNYNYVVEFRSADWYDQEVYDFLKRQKITLAMSELSKPGAQPNRHNIQTTDTAYVRIVGRYGFYKSFERMRETPEIEDTIRFWAGQIKDFSQETYAFINNNFAGNAPETVNHMKKYLGLPVKEWKDPGLMRFF